MKLRNIIYSATLLLAISFLALSCVKDDGGEQSAPPPAGDPTEEPTVDVVEEQYNGSVAVLSEDDAVVAYLRKRFPNITSEIEEQTRVAILGEQRAATMVADADAFKQVERFWRKNNALMFVKPGREALALLLKLKGLSSHEMSSEALESYKNLVLYATKADGYSMFYFDPRNGGAKSLVIVEHEEDSSSSEESVAYPALSDYQMGRIAERTASWLKENVRADERTVDISLCDAADDNYTKNMVTLTCYNEVIVDHNLAQRMWYTVDHYVKALGYRRVDAVFQVNVVCGYNEVLGSDIYDLSFMESFDAATAYCENTVVWEHLEYRHKYAGGCYDTCRVKAELYSDRTSFDFYGNTTVHEPVPTPQDKGYTTTHDPGSTTLGGSVTGGGTFGSSGVSGSISGSFSCSFTLPKTTVAVPEDAMPLSYSGKNNSVSWAYDADITLYEVHPITNPDFIEPHPTLCSNYVTEQALTFQVQKTKEQELGDVPVYLDLAVEYVTYHECAKDDKERCREWQSHKFRLGSYLLPTVARHFEDYSPKAHSSGPVDAASGWPQLEATLKTNNNYLALAGDYLFRSPTEAGLVTVAERYWDETLDIFTNGNYTDRTRYDYVITLQDSKGKRLKRGLYIHDGIWEQVEDVDEYIAKL